MSRSCCNLFFNIIWCHHLFPYGPRPRDRDGGGQGVGVNLSPLSLKIDVLGVHNQGGLLQ